MKHTGTETYRASYVKPSECETCLHSSLPDKSKCLPAEVLMQLKMEEKPVIDCPNHHRSSQLRLEFYSAHQDIDFDLLTKVYDRACSITANRSQGVDGLLENAEKVLRGELE